jgi:hypothetical protein
MQKAVYARLAAFAGLTAIVSTRVYDGVAPQNPTFPYVVVGDTTTIPFDTHSTTGGEHTVMVHGWSQYRGSKEIKQIQDQIYSALHRYALSVTGVATVDCEIEFAESFNDDDGLTRHGVQRARVILDG